MADPHPSRCVPWVRPSILRKKALTQESEAETGQTYTATMAGADTATFAVQTPCGPASRDARGRRAGERRDRRESRSGNASVPSPPGLSQ